MKRQVLLGSVLAVVLLSGCGTPTSASNQLKSSADTQTANATQVSASINPQVFLVTRTIYEGISKAISKNLTTAFDKQLQSITDLGQNSAQGTPNSILYEDAVTIVSMDDAINGEGGPTSQYDILQKSLSKTKADLDKYRPTTGQAS